MNWSNCNNYSNTNNSNQNASAPHAILVAIQKITDITVICQGFETLMIMFENPDFLEGELTPNTSLGTSLRTIVTMMMFHSSWEVRDTLLLFLSSLFSAQVKYNKDNNNYAKNSKNVQVIAKKGNIDVIRETKLQKMLDEYIWDKNVGFINQIIFKLNDGNPYVKTTALNVIGRIAKTEEGWFNIISSSEAKNPIIAFPNCCVGFLELNDSTIRFSSIQLLIQFLQKPFSCTCALALITWDYVYLVVNDSDWEVRVLGCSLIFELIVKKRDWVKNLYQMGVELMGDEIRGVREEAVRCFYKILKLEREGGGISAKSEEHKFLVSELGKLDWAHLLQINQVEATYDEDDELFPLEEGQSATPQIIECPM